MTNNYLNDIKTNDIKTNLMLNNINNEKIINMFLKSAMEKFLPEKLQSLAYSDTSICYYKNRFLIDIHTLGHIMLLSGTHLIQRALVIGCGNGYIANFLSDIAQEIIAVDEDNYLLDQGKLITKNLGKNNIKFIHSNLNNLPKEDKFDLIIVNGAVNKVLDSWLNLLENKGSLLAVVYVDGLKRIVKHEKIDETIIKTNHIHSSLPYLIGFNNNNEFVF